MNTTAKIQIESSLSALAKAHQELLAHFESSIRKAGGEAKTDLRAAAEHSEHAKPLRRQRASAK
jgi:hypothetical protein